MKYLHSTRKYNNNALNQLFMAATAAILFVLNSSFVLAAGEEASSLRSPVQLDSNQSDEQRWSIVKQQIFHDKELLDGSSMISLGAPERAYDASMVPVSVKILQAQTTDNYIKELYIIADKNPAPMAGKFMFRAGAGWRGLETRIRINEYTNLRAVAITNDDEAYVVSRYVKASGGCSAPAMGAAAADIGKFNLKINSNSETEHDGDEIQMQVKINHPNNSGMQFDQISRLFIPAYFIHTIGVKYDGEEIIKLETNFSLSENPTLRFDFVPEKKNGTIDIYAIDSKLALFEDQWSN